MHASVDNDNQQALSFVKLGDYYFKNKAYVQAQSCYDSCLLVMDSRYEDYEKLKSLLTDLTELVTNLRIIQTQDSLQRIAVLPEEERNRLIDDKITAIKEQENTRKEQERREQAERNFYRRNDMLSRGDAFSQGNRGGDWYFYNPVTIALGKNDFKRKWGRRKLEDNWRRRNKASIGLADETGEELAEMTGGEREVKDVKSREYYLQDLPLTPEMLQASEKQIEEAYYKAGEIYLYRLNDPEKALECFDAYIQRFKNTANLPMVYYLASTTALKAPEPDCFNGRAFLLTPQNPRLTSMKQPAFSPPALRRVAQKSNDCGLRSLRHSPIPDSPYKVWQYRLYWKTLFIMYRGQKPRTLSGYCQPRHGRVRDKSDCPFRASDGGSPHCARKRNCNPNKKPLQVFCGVFYCRFGAYRDIFGDGSAG